MSGNRGTAPSGDDQIKGENHDAECAHAELRRQHHARDVGDLENNAVSDQLRARPRAAARTVSRTSSRSPASVLDGSMMALPHCGQLQPKSVCTMATRQIGQARTRKGFASDMTAKCGACAVPAIQGDPYP